MPLCKLQWFNWNDHMLISYQKLDLVTEKKDVEEFLDPEPTFLLSELNQRMAPQFAKLNKALIDLLHSVRRKRRCEG
ncbi:hypothetical protein HN51_059672 [Arachis hypogaea]